MNRNTVLITVDSLRADHCGYWGYERDTSPTLDRMADEGVAFENAVAPGPKTPESMPVIFTGAFPATDLESSELGSWREQIRPHMTSRETIAERFSRLGYTTAAFTTNAFTSEHFGFDTGFDHFEDFLETDFRPGPEVPDVARGLLKWVRREGNWKPWEKYYDRVAQFVRNAPEPFFLWVFLMDVHAPYMVPRQYRTENSWPEMVYANWKASELMDSEHIKKRVVSAYDDTIRYTDEFLERLLEDVAGRETAVVVHSDHGEAFGERGEYGHDSFLFEENVHVPLVVGNVDAKTAIHEPVSLRQLPEILDVVRRHDTGDLGAELRSRSSERWNPAVCRSQEGNCVGVRFGRFKLVITDGDAALYDLETDSAETRDASKRYPRVADALSSVADNHLRHNDETRTISEQASKLVAGRS